ncbi:MAG: hypothetical protein IPM97_01045 [Bdellovibrionaceae bacterium]|nr:hypothetical protein [Pseudobdellovibrionaceae bacterium]
MGNSGNTATAVSISGDASVANTGVLTLATSGGHRRNLSEVTWMPKAVLLVEPI